MITTGKMAKMLTDLYSRKEMIDNGVAVMLWGAPGVGKSQCVAQFCKQLEHKTGKKVNMHLVSLLLVSPIDLRGVPVKSVTKEGQEVTKWLIPDIFRMDASDKVINVLFLDELSAAPPSVQACAYQICLDRRVGEHQLPHNCIVIAAGNRVTDRAVAYKMPKPLANRLTHFEVTCGIDDWKEWAYKAGIDSRIIAFLSYYKKNLSAFDPTTDEVAFATPRSWERVSLFIRGRELSEVMPLVSGTVGEGMAHTFAAYTAVYKDLPTYDDIISGKAKVTSKQSKNVSLQFAVATMIAYNTIEVIQKHNPKTQEILNGVANYIGQMAEEMQTMIVRDIARNIDNAEILVNNEGMSKILDNIGSLLFD